VNIRSAKSAAPFNYRRKQLDDAQIHADEPLPGNWLAKKNTIFAITDPPFVLPVLYG